MCPCLSFCLSLTTFTRFDDSLLSYRSPALPIHFIKGSDDQGVSGWNYPQRQMDGGLYRDHRVAKTGKILFITSLRGGFPIYGLRMDSFV